MSRRPSGPFGWLDARLLTEGWLVRIGRDGVAVLVLLALAADERGVSFWGRGRMGPATGLSREALDQALDRLLALGLVAHRPWRTGLPDGVWQILPLPQGRGSARGAAPVRIADVLSRLGLER